MHKSFKLAPVALSAILSVTAVMPGWAAAPSQPVPGQYLVVFQPGTSNPTQEAGRMAAQAGGRVLHTYSHALKGAAIRVPEHMAATLATALSHNPNVLSFEQDATVSANETLLSPALNQSGATWGLDRIDQRDLPLNSNYSYQYTGSGVYAFVIDTGILSSHTEFTGRVQAGYTSINDGLGTADCNGHGTHVAGTIAGTTWGVAKGAYLVPVRVLDCSGSGTWSGVVAGVDWVAGQSSLRPAVGNMSLGGGYSSTVNAAVAGAVQKGVTMAVAAGNESTDACSKSPASEPSAITVGATTSTDAKASYSNYGTCVDLFAPGSSITSAWYSGPTSTNTISGTSMATPHVAGVAALALAANPGATPAAVTNFLTSNATLNKVTSAGTGSPNKLLYSMATGAPTEPTVTSVRVTAISGSAKKLNASAWRAYASVTITDLSGNAVANATVAGLFSNGGGAKSCVTGSNGICQMTSSNLNYKTTASSAFSVTGVTGNLLSYVPGQNTVSSITILRP